MIAMLGFFSVYAGLIYNDFFSLPLDLFGSSWEWEEGRHTVSSSAVPPYINKHPRKERKRHTHKSLGPFFRSFVFLFCFPRSFFSLVMASFPSKMMVTTAVDDDST